MSDAFALLTSENAAGIGGKANKGRHARKKLGDITNMAQQDRSLTQRDKSLAVPIDAKGYIEQLQKENLALQKVLADRNKIIEVAEFELQKLRLNLRKLQQQNSLLAKSNRQILQDLNSGKDKLKVLRHELGCKNGMLKAKELVTKEHLKEKECEELEDEVKQTRCKSSKACDKIGQNERTHKPKPKSFDSEVQLQDEIENKRPCRRRMSCRFNDQELKPAEDQFEMAIPETSQLPEIHSISDCLSNQNGDNKDIYAPIQTIGSKRPFVRRKTERFKSQESTTNSSEDLMDLSSSEEVADVDLDSTILVADVDLDSTILVTDVDLVQDSRRSSNSRPSRHAAKKVQTYKEVPINVKMRRPV